MGLLRPRNFNPRVRDYALAVTPQHAVLVLARPHNMVFTQRRGFVLGASIGLQIRSLRCRVLVCHAADSRGHRLFGSIGYFW